MNTTSNGMPSTDYILTKAAESGPRKGKAQGRRNHQDRERSQKIQGIQCPRESINETRSSQECQ